MLLQLICEISDLRVLQLDELLKLLNFEFQDFYGFPKLQDRLVLLHDYALRLAFVLLACWLDVLLLLLLLV